MCTMKSITMTHNTYFTMSIQSIYIYITTDRFGILRSLLLGELGDIIMYNIHCHSQNIDDTVRLNRHLLCQVKLISYNV